MEKELVGHLTDNHNIHFKNLSTVIIDGATFSKHTFGDFCFNTLVETDNISIFAKEFKTDKDKKAFYNDVFERLKVACSVIARERFETQAIPESKTSISYVPVIDVKNNETKLINPSTLQISEMSYEVWQRVLTPEEKKAVAQSERLAMFTYDPYDISTLIMKPFENYDLLKVNTYSPPEWRKQVNDKNAKCPKSIGKLLHHLFPKEESLEYILDWLFFTLVSRNEAYLVLNGAKGIGKGIFCSVIKAMVGPNNYTEAPDSFLESDFNAALDKRRVIVLDEFKVDKAKHSKLKRYINKFQNIEKKGKDADKSVEIYNSYIISNNDETDMYLEYDDRRFSVADLTTLPLTDSMPLTLIKKLTDELEIEDSPLIKEFGYYIFNRGAVMYNEFSTYRGDRYHKLIQTSLKLWQKSLLDRIIEGKSHLIDIKNFGRELSMTDNRIKFPSRVEKIQDFLNNYRYGGDKKLGEIVKDEGEWCIKVNVDLLEDNTINDEEEDDGDFL